MQNSFFIQQSGISGWKQIGTGHMSGDFLLAESGRRLGLNTNKPQSTLHVVQQGDGGAALILQSSGTGDDTIQNHKNVNFNSYLSFDDIEGSVGKVGYFNSGYNYLKVENRASTDPYVILTTKPENQISIDKDGNLGVYTLLPSGKIHVIQSGAGISDNSIEAQHNNIAVMQMTGSSSNLNPEFTLKSDGKLGLNNYTPRYTLDISGHANAEHSTLKSDSYIYGYEESYLTGMLKGHPSAPAIDIDFDGRSFRNLTLSGTTDHYITTSNGTDLGENEMKSVSVRLWASGEPAGLIFDNDITFLGYVPTGLAANGVGILSFNSFGPNVKDTIAVFRQPGDIFAGPPGPAGIGKHGEPGEEFRNKIIGGDFGANPWQRLVPNSMGVNYMRSAHETLTGFYNVKSGEYTADRFCHSSANNSMPPFPLETGANTIFFLKSDNQAWGNKTFTDESDSPYTIGELAVHGGGGSEGAIHATPSMGYSSKWGNSSIRFQEGSPANHGSCLYVKGLKDFKPSTCDATIEFWYKFNGYAWSPEEGAGTSYMEDDAILTYGRYNEVVNGKGWGFSLGVPGIDGNGDFQRHGFMAFTLAAGGGGYRIQDRYPIGLVGGKSISLWNKDDETLVDGGWHHIAVTHDVSSYLWRMFVDGKLRDSAYQPHLEYDDDDYDFLLGAGLLYHDATATGHYSSCSLDYIRITSGEALYKAPVYNVYRDSDHPKYENFYFGYGDGPSYPTTGSLAIECVGSSSGLNTGDTYVTGSGFSGYMESYDMLEHKIEGYNIRDLMTNDSTLSFWAKIENTSGVFPISLRNHDNTISYVTTYDLCHTGVWTKYDLMIPPITGSGGGPILESSFNLNNGIGLHVSWPFSASSGLNVPGGCVDGTCPKNIYGENVTGTSGQWITGFYVGFSGNTIGGSLSEESGTKLKIASPEIKHGWRTGPELAKVRSQQQELELCKRYYERLDYVENSPVGVGQCVGTGSFPYPPTIDDLLRTGSLFDGVVVNYQEKRDVPSVSIYTDYTWSPSHMYTHGIFGVTDFTSQINAISGMGFDKITKNQCSISGDILNKRLFAGHSTILKTSGDASIFIDSEL